MLIRIGDIELNPEAVITVHHIERDAEGHVAIVYVPDHKIHVTAEELAQIKAFHAGPVMAPSLTAVDLEKIRQESAKPPHLAAAYNGVPSVAFAMPPATEPSSAENAEPEKSCKNCGNGLPNCCFCMAFSNWIPRP